MANGDYRYKLDNRPGRKKQVCPDCRQKTFVPYIDRETSEFLAEHVGKCDRQGSCCYHYTPSKYFEDNPGAKPQQEAEARPQQLAPKPPKPPKYIDFAVFKKSLADYDNNSFVKYLKTLFDDAIVSKAIREYMFGTSHSRWAGACVFWFITAGGKVKAGQLKAFDETGHTASYYSKRAEKYKKCTEWVHTTLSYKYNREQTTPPQWLTEYIERGEYCFTLYGEHLLHVAGNEKKPVALVEAPKTAIIASMYLPDYVWLAFGALEYFTEDRIKALQGREVTLFPDLSIDGKAFEKWSNRAKVYSHIADFSMNDTLEKIATDEERAQGLDIADYLIRINHKDAVLSGQLITEFLQSDNLTDEEQKSIVAKYIQKGLSKRGLNEALGILIKKHGFIQE